MKDLKYLEESDKENVHVTKQRDRMMRDLQVRELFPFN